LILAAREEELFVMSVAIDADNSAVEPEMAALKLLSSKSTFTVTFPELPPPDKPVPAVTPLIVPAAALCATLWDIDDENATKSSPSVPANPCTLTVPKDAVDFAGPII